MKSTRTRLDRLVRGHNQWSLRQVRDCLLQGGIKVNGYVATNMSQVVDQFTHVEVNGKTLRKATPVYILINKPKGVVSATKDKAHTTVLDVLNFWHIQWWQFTPAVFVSPMLRPLNYSRELFKRSKTLHIVGRLDFNSTGIVLLTNDGAWSRRLSTPTQKVEKHYRVTLEDPIDPVCIEAFAKGIYFSYENVITQPATLKIINCYVAEMTLVEGRYHQIKRMFGAFQNKVLELHRFSVGNIVLDNNLALGRWRPLTLQEVNGISL